MSRVLWRASLRYLLRHPWQMGLSFVGVALGVAVVVAIDLANTSAQRAFLLSTDSVVGRATHQIVGGSRGIPEDIFRAVRIEAGVRLAAPVVEGDVAAPDYPGRTFRVLGVDPFAEAPFRPYLAGLNSRGQTALVSFLTRPATAIMSYGTGRELGLGLAGDKAAEGQADQLTVRAGGVRQRLSIIALLEPADALSRRALDSLLVTDIATAQELLGLTGRLSRIDLMIPAGPPGQAELAKIRAVLPPGAEVRSAAARSQSVAQMTRAFSLNLSALSLLALIVGMFLIYNTMTFSVVQRRSLIGALRVVGVTRREIFSLIVAEAALLGLLGTAAGLVLGVALAQGLVRLVTQTITDLYFVVSVRELTISGLGLLKGLGLGLGASLVAALAPALEATATQPRAVLNRSTLEARSQRVLPWAAVAGVCLMLVGAGLLLLPSRDLILSFGGLFTIFLGCVLVTPVAVVGLLRVVQLLIGTRTDIVGRLCIRSVLASLSRTAVAIAALMVAVSVTVGVGIMIESFRQTVAYWLENALQADIYIAPPSLVSRWNEGSLDPAVVARLSAAPGVEAVSTYRRVSVESPTGRVQLVALRLDVDRYSSYRFVEGRPEVVWPAFEAEHTVIVSEPYAYHHRLRVGGAVRLRTDRGVHDFRVAGIFADYGSDRGLVMMSRRTYEQFWHDRGVSSLGLWLSPDRDVAAMVASLRRLVGSVQEVELRSNRSLRQASLEIFDRTFTITSVLHLLTTAVAFIGVLSALMALQLEREREFGVLRATGFTPRQVWGLVTAQTGVMGLLAGLLALPVGLLLASVLVFVINRRSFGWTLELEIVPGLLVQAVLLAVLAALLAGVYPAFKMSRTSPALALREE
ncbi:MAG: ABC transporter permease [Desulfurellaceae bacterium]|nr:ABC transporter permease [Desulfurellaceae bacterium]